MNADHCWARQTEAVRLLGITLASFVLSLHLSISAAFASDPAELMDSFEHLCLGPSLDFASVSGTAAADHLPILDQKVTTAGGIGLRTTTWLIRKTPPTALIVAGKAVGSQMTMCGVTDHVTPLADMANELAVRIRNKQIATREIGVNDVALDNNGGTVHIVSDPGGNSSSGFFLFRLAP